MAEQIEIVDKQGNPLHPDGTPAYPRVYDMEDFLATGPGVAPALPLPPVPPITAETLANATPNLIQMVQSLNPPPVAVNDPTSSFLDKFANLWSTSKLFDIGVISAVGGLVLYGILHNYGSGTDAKNIPPVPVFSRAAAQAAQQQVAKILNAQTQTLQQMGYTNSQIQAPRDVLQFTQDSAIGLNSASPSVPKSRSGALIVTGPKAPNHYATLHELNNSNYFAALSKTPTEDDLLANSAALHGDTASVQR